MAEDIVEDVGLLEIVELLAAADECSGGKLAVGQHLEKWPRGDEAGDRNHLPAGHALQRWRSSARNPGWLRGRCRAPRGRRDIPGQTWPLSVCCWRSNSMRQMAWSSAL